MKPATEGVSDYPRALQCTGAPRPALETSLDSMKKPGKIVLPLYLAPPCTLKGDVPGGHGKAGEDPRPEWSGGRGGGVLDVIKG